jgi:hypothetical protein
MHDNRILSKQDSAQLRSAVEDGKPGQELRIFVRLPYNICHGIIEVQEVAGRGMLISVQVAGDPFWHFMQPTQLLCESSEEKRHAL